MCGFLLALIGLLALMWAIQAYAPRMSETQQPEPDEAPDEQEQERDPVERERERREQQDDDVPDPPAERQG